MAWVGLAGDAVDLIPFVTGVGEVTRAVNIGSEFVDTAYDFKKANDRFDAAIDSYKNLKKLIKVPILKFIILLKKDLVK